MRYRVKLIPRSRRQRPGYPLKPTSITVHNTANPGATADDHAEWLGGSDTSASAHIFVDDLEAVMVIPLGEQAWHAGTNAGNTTSVGIEVCEFTYPARQDAADANAQRLISDMLTGEAPAGWNLTHLALKDVRTHQSWKQYGTTGKYCPRMILPWWDRFVAGIGALMEGEDMLDCYELTIVATSRAALGRLQAKCASLGVKAPAVIEVVAGTAYVAKTHARKEPGPNKAEELAEWVKRDAELVAFKGVPTSAETVASIGVVREGVYPAPLPAASGGKPFAIASQTPERIVLERGK